MPKEILINTKDLHIGDILNGKKIVDITKRSGFVFIFLEDGKKFLFGENLKITIRRNSV